MPVLLSRAQVAALIGHPPHRVTRWTRARGITGVSVSGQAFYLADDIHHALALRPAPGPLRLARFIRNPLNV